MRRDGISILITDHQVRETLQITDRSYVIRKGQVLCHGTPDEVLSNEEARKHYFGEDMDLGTTSSPPPPHVPDKSPVSPPAASTPPPPHLSDKNRAERSKGIFPRLD